MTISATLLKFERVRDAVTDSRIRTSTVLFRCGMSRPRRTFLADRISSQLTERHRAFLGLIGKTPIENASEELFNGGMEENNRGAENVCAADRLTPLSNGGKLGLVDVSEVVDAGQVLVEAGLEESFHQNDARQVVRIIAVSYGDQLVRQQQMSRNRAHA